MLPASIVAAQAATDGAAQSHHHALDDTHLDMEENGLHKMAAFLAAPAEGEAGLIITGGPTPMAVRWGKNWALRRSTSPRVT